MKKAKDPSNYIWENLGFSLLRRGVGLLLCMGFLTLAIFVAYRIQFVLQKSVNHFDNYEQFDCSIFHRSFDSESVVNPSMGEAAHIILGYSKVRYQREAYKTWENFYESSSNANMVKSYVNGTLSCFCNDQY